MLIMSELYLNLGFRQHIAILVCSTYRNDLVLDKEPKTLLVEAMSLFYHKSAI